MRFLAVTILVRGPKGIFPANNVVFRSAGSLLVTVQGGPATFLAFTPCKDGSGTPPLQNMAREISFSFYSFPCAVRGLIRILATTRAETQIFGMRGSVNAWGFPCG
jgi:hypothetical protein